MVNGEVVNQIAETHARRGSQPNRTLPETNGTSHPPKRSSSSSDAESSKFIGDVEVFWKFVFVTEYFCLQAYRSARGAKFNRYTGSWKLITGLEWIFIMSPHICRRVITVPHLKRSNVSSRFQYCVYKVSVLIILTYNLFFKQFGLWYNSSCKES